MLTKRGKIFWAAAIIGIICGGVMVYIFKYGGSAEIGADAFIVAFICAVICGCLSIRAYESGKELYRDADKDDNGE